MAKAAPWTKTDAQVRKRGEQTGLDTLVVHAVNDAVVSFMTQKMTVDADDARFDEIMDEVVRVCAKVEPDCQILL